MKRLIFTLLFSLFLFEIGCGSQPAPAWRQEAFSDIKNFVFNYLSGENKYAEKYFEKAVEDLKKTTNPDEIVKIYLIKCSLSHALLNYSECSEAKPWTPLLKNGENISFYRFISGKAQQKTDVPPKYRKIFELSRQECDSAEINSEIKALKNPLSKLIASSFAIKSACYDVETINSAIETASNEGWRQASLTYLVFAEKYYEKIGNTNDLNKTKKRIELITGDNI